MSPRTYARRRAAAVSALVGLVLACRWVLGLLGGGPLTAPEARPLVPAAAHVYVVRPGDTLWQVARALQPEGDVRATVDRLAAGHGGPALRPGERISLSP